MPSSKTTATNKVLDSTDSASASHSTTFSETDVTDAETRNVEVVSEPSNTFEDDVYTTTVRGRPDRSYVWAATSRAHPSSVDRLKRMGFEPVREGEADAPHAELTTEGYYTTGDLLLMQTSKERAKEIRRRKDEEFLRRIRITEEMWEQSGSVEGVEKRMDRNSKTFFIANNPLAK